jgi:hypothetical protein
MAILTLHRNNTKNDSIRENYVYYVYVMRKVIILSVTICLDHERHIHSKPEDQRFQASIKV